MQFVDFKERSVIIAENQPEYIPLPAHQVKDKEGTTFVRISFNKEELDEINRTGGIYMSVLTFGKPFPPMMVYANNPFPYLQPVTREISAIYFKDIDAVYFYTPEGQPLKQIPNDMFDEWYPVEGFTTFKWYRIKKEPNVKNGGGHNVYLHISMDKQVGGSKLLNNQFFNKDDNQPINL